MPVETFDRILNYLKASKMLPKSGMIHLFNWGEPMLHPQINDIIKTCGKYGLLAFISSNLIHLPKLQARALRLLTGIGVSLSGFTDDSYRRIHGKKLKTVLENINKLYLMAVKADCRWRPHVIWHRYPFNEREMSVAKKYFWNRGMEFLPSLACLSGIDLTIDYFFDDNMKKAERKKIEQDLYVDYIRYILALSKTDNYECPQWSYLTIDENARLQLCCGWSNTVKQSDLGLLFDFSTKDIKALKRNSPLCSKCISLGIAKFGNSVLKDRLLDVYLSNPEKNTAASLLDQNIFQHGKQNIEE